MPPALLSSNLGLDKSGCVCSGLDNTLLLLKPPEQIGIRSCEGETETEKETEVVTEIETEEEIETEKETEVVTEIETEEETEEETETKVEAG